MPSEPVVRGHRVGGIRLTLCGVAVVLMGAACTATGEPSKGAALSSSDFEATTGHSGGTACADRFKRLEAGSGLAWRFGGDLPVTAPVVAGSTVSFGANGALAGEGCVGVVAVETG